MKIYIFVEHYPNLFKPSLDTLYSEFIRQGHDIKIFALGEYSEILNEDVVKYNLKEKTRYYSTSLRTLPRFFPKMIFTLIFSPKRSISDIVRVFDRSKSLKLNILTIARMLLLPKDYPDICLIHNLTAAKLFTFLPRFYNNIPVIMYFHGGEVPLQGKIENPQDIFKEMDFVFTNTKHSKSQAVNRGCDEDKIMINPVGFRISSFNSEKGKIYKKNGVLRIISIGRLSEEKGFIYGLKAIKHLVDSGICNIHYKIIGDSYLYAQFKEYIIENKLAKHIELAGKKSRIDVINELGKADIFLLTSIPTSTCEETQACVVQEAMLMKLPVITTITGGVPESIPMEMKAFSVDCHDSSGIVSKINDFLTMPHDEMARLGNICRDFAINNYDISKLAKNLLNCPLKLRKY